MTTTNLIPSFVMYDTIHRIVETVIVQNRTYGIYECKGFEDDRMVIGYRIMFEESGNRSLLRHFNISETQEDAKRMIMNRTTFKRH